MPVSNEKSAWGLVYNDVARPSGSRLRTPEVMEFVMSPRTASLTGCPLGPTRKRSVPTLSHNRQGVVPDPKTAQASFPANPNCRDDLRSSETLLDRQAGVPNATHSFRKDRVRRRLWGA